MALREQQTLEVAAVEAVTITVAVVRVVQV
jgi:hypothetical protein